MKKFDVPIIYRSPLITAIKRQQKEMDGMKKDFSPTLLDFGPLKLYLARHFGFCYGVENAIDIAFRTVEENPGKRIFLLSEMIHNPHVNADLRSRGVSFLQDTNGNNLVPFTELKRGDIVIIPAFGTTLDMEKNLTKLGVHTEKYNTTCPFVEKVWNRSAAIAEKNYTVVIHGKPSHEETRATFSHASVHSPAVIISDMQQARELAKYITGEKIASGFYNEFRDQYSVGFDAAKDLQKIGVVNQTTMLAADTEAITDHLKLAIAHRYNLTNENLEEHFADTRDTLCYATNDNQRSVINFLQIPADLAIVVGGYNSSNTSHLVELCEQKLPTYFIQDDERILSSTEILHYDLHAREEILTSPFLPATSRARVLITSGASCPDAIVENVIRKLTEFFPARVTFSEMLDQFSPAP